MWGDGGGGRAKVVPVVIGALGTVPLRLNVSLKGTRSGHINLTYTEITTVGVGKNTEEGVRARNEDKYEYKKIIVRLHPLCGEG